MKKYYLNLRGLSVKVLVLVSLFSSVFYGCKKDKILGTTLETKQISIGKGVYTEGGSGTSDFTGAVVFDTESNDGITVTLNLGHNRSHIMAIKKGESASSLNLRPGNYTYSLFYSKQIKNTKSKDYDYYITSTEKDSVLTIKKGKTLKIPISLSLLSGRKDL